MLTFNGGGELVGPADRRAIMLAAVALSVFWDPANLDARKEIADLRLVLKDFPGAFRFYSTLPGTTPGLTRPRPRPPEHDRRPRPRCPPPGGLFRFFLKGTSCVCRISRYGLD